MQEKIFKELKELNKTMNSIRTFIIAEAQLIKNISLSVDEIKRGVKSQV